MQALATDLFNSKNFYKDQASWSDRRYFRCNTPRQITDGDWNHGAPSFSADGKWVAFSALRVEDPEHVFRKSTIYVANVDNGEIRALTKNNGTNTAPRGVPSSARA